MSARSSVALVCLRRRLRRGRMPFRIVLARSHMRRSLVLIAMGLACQAAARGGISARFEVSPDRSQIGFDTPFSIVAHIAAAPPGPFEIRWTQVGGPSLRDVAVTQGG